MRVAITIACLLALASAAPEADRVFEIPDMAKFDTFKLYSGYLDIGGTEGKSLHYVFQESKSDPANDPLVVWFNGGPGCSSVLAWAQEHGPYIMEDGSNEFKRNNHSWNTEANMIYIESPAGVGYSYTKTSQPFYDDDISAVDNYAAIQKWFELFPEFKDNKFFISGESYAGIYVPYLAHQIITNENDIKLEGIMVGNGVTNWTLDCEPAYEALGFWHNLIDLDLEEDLEKNHCLN
jgi:cathepsin A (carboxypeptidase C)